MDALTLSTDDLRLEFCPPGSLYTGVRFDWTTQVRQIHFRGTPLLTQETNNPASGHQGYGLASEFGITTPLGFDDCAVGQWFPKVGVGLLRRPDEANYLFSRRYEVQSAQFSVEQKSGAALRVTAESPSERGYGWRLHRDWSVEGSQVRLTTSVVNTGTKAWATEEYCHNFFGWGDPLGPSWSLSLPNPLSVESMAQWVNPDDAMHLEGAELRWKTVPQQDFFLRAPALQPGRWTLTHAPSGLSVTESLDAPVLSFHLWGRAHVVSPELFHRVALAPGARAQWSRTWQFEQRPR